MKALTKSLAKRENTIALLLATPKSAYTPETFHKLRVELKKMNALFDIIEYCLPAFKREKNFKPFKEIFEQAGKVRELQITEKLLHTTFRRKTFSYSNQLLLKKQKSAIAAFFKIITPVFIAKLHKIFQSIDRFGEKTKKADVQSYLQKKRKKLKNILLQSKIQEEEVHEVRKRLKTYNYNRRIVEKKSTKTGVQSTDHLSDLVGKWHDLRITLDYINGTRKENRMQPAESKQLVAVTKKLDDESNLLFKDILKAIPHSEFVSGA